MSSWTILGVSSTATVEEIKKAFREKAKKCHPDLRPDKKKAEEEFKALGAAYDLCLKLAENPRHKPFFDMGLDAMRDEIRRDQEDLWKAWEDLRRDRRKPPDTSPPRPEELKVFRILSDKKYNKESKTWTGVEWVPLEFSLRGGLIHCLLDDEEFMIRCPPFKFAMWLDAAVTLKNGVKIKMKIGIDDSKSY